MVQNLGLVNWVCWDSQINVCNELSPIFNDQGAIINHRIYASTETKILIRNLLVVQSRYQEGCSSGLGAHS